jgi:CHAT domain-containing protein
VWWSVSDLSSLPIHAAGIYDTSDSGISNAHEECASNYIVSSYIPTFSALAKARKAFKPVSRTTLRGLVVHEPAPGKGFRAIPAAVEEARVVGKCFEEADAHLITGPEASPTVSGVLRSLQEGDVHVLHLACHGTQHANPLQSSFILADGDLSIAELMKLKLPTAFLAFLSACETAKGSEAHPDQAVHLAASMLFCGFRSTIGTMW